VGPVGGPVHLYTYLHVREDELTLYGFHGDDARRMFEHLITISGVGPKLALAVLSALQPETLAAVVAARDTVALTRVPGVGRKTAERLVLELKEKLEREWGAALPAYDGGGSLDEDVIAALMALGYTALEARRATAQAGSGADDVPLEDRVRRALQTLGG
jgi:Holliday junction DNA helicase RuvA